MKTHSGLESAETFLRIHLLQPSHLWTSKPTGPYVTISRESGTHGSRLATALAKELNKAGSEETPPWTVFDGELVNEMLRSARLSPSLARFLPEDHIPEFKSQLGELIGLHPNLWELNQRAVALTRELARVGHSILVGRGANYASTGIPNGLHVRLVASEAHRAREMAAELGISRSDAQVHNLQIDQARKRFVKSMFNADVTDPSAYSLLINTEFIPTETAVRLLVELIGLRSQVPA